MQEMKPQSPKSQTMEEQNYETDDFSFASLHPNASPISAEDAFLDGRIRAAAFPMLETAASDRSWPVPPTPELGKIKSHSTGFSKLWRFGSGDKDKIRRSSSDGKDAFLFMRNNDPSDNKTKTKTTKKKTASCNHERLYAGNRAENEKSKQRKSYLPYRSSFMGFFSAPSGFDTHF